MKKTLFFLVLWSCFFYLQASANSDSTYAETAIVLVHEGKEIFATLTLPHHVADMPVALIVSGSGPTDRDGNNPMMKNDALKKLAHHLANRQIASLRFDKRGVAASMSAVTNEAELVFDHYVGDVQAWVTLLNGDERFGDVVIIGHSEGSLIGMLASEHADKFISIAGLAKPADRIIKEQLAAQPKEVQDMTYPILDSLTNGHLVNNVNPMLYSLFRPSVQPYLISWFKYNPEEEIKKLNMPILLVQGTNDIQVPTEEAEILAKSNAQATLRIIENMNHNFRIVKDDDRAANISTYSNNSLPIAEEMVQAITAFILKD